jgi:hypothetical protein
MITKILVPNKLTDPILKWAKENIDDTDLTSIPADHEGDLIGYRHLDWTELPVKQWIKEVDDYILKELNIKSLPINKDDGYWICLSKKGCKVKNHKDPKPSPKSSMIRFNLMIQKPTSGGLPVIREDEINIKQNQVWICLASEYYHRVTEVKGNKDRILLSIGHTIRDNKLKELGL